MRRFRFCLIQFLIVSLLSSTLISGQKPYPASVIAVKGSVRVKFRGEGEWKAVRKGMGLVEKDKIRTGRDSRAEIAYDDGTIVLLPSHVEVVIKELKKSKKSRNILKAFVGTVLASVKKLKKKRKSRFRVATPVGTISVRGTEFGVEVLDQVTVETAVFDGWVIVKDFVKERALPKDGMELTLQFLHEMKLKKNRQTRIVGDKGLSKSQEMTDKWKDRQKELAQKQSEWNVIREEILSTPDEERWKSREDIRTQLEEESEE